MTMVLGVPVWVLVTLGLMALYLFYLDRRTRKADRDRLSDTSKIYDELTFLSKELRKTTLLANQLSKRQSDRDTMTSKRPVVMPPVPPMKPVVTARRGRHSQPED